jgi:hypothetical protein
MGGMKWLMNEPPRDPQLAEALRRVEAGPDTVDADLLRQRIVAAARPRLARLRSPAPRWWEWLDRWMPVALSAGVAASLIAALLLSGAGDIGGSAGYTAEVFPESTLVNAAYSEEVGGEQVAASLIAPQGGDWLFEQAVIQ